MDPDLAEALERTQTGVWVAIDVVQMVFGIQKRQAYILAKTEGWRTAPGVRPREYSFEDIRTTHHNRKTEP